MKALVAVVERKEGQKGFWTRIGTAFENKDGSWSLQFDYMPTNIHKTGIQMRDIDKREPVKAPAQRIPPTKPPGSTDFSDELLV
jgi:hypothetical protein